MLFALFFLVASLCAEFLGSSILDCYRPACCAACCCRAGESALAFGLNFQGTLQGVEPMCNVRTETQSVFAALVMLVSSTSIG